MLIKVSEATNNQINWLVAKIEGHQSRCEWMIKSGWAEWQSYESAWGNPIPNSSTNWAQGGPIIEREKISAQTDPTDTEPEGWSAYFRQHLFKEDGTDCWQNGPTPLIAAMRCYCVSRLGDIVEVPEELL